MLNQLWDGVGINAFRKGRKIIRNRRGGLEHSFGILGLWKDLSE